MIDQQRLERIHLDPKPWFQRVIATFMLMPNYNNPFGRTRIILEGEENIPRKTGCIFVMNHTDRYNYWPFQYKLYRRKLGFTATWVKGKYYENNAMGWFMDTANNIPLPSKGYVLTKDFQAKSGRKPTDEEYAALKRHTDGVIDRAEAEKQGGDGVRAFLAKDWPEGDYALDLETRFRAMMLRVVEICREGMDKGLHLLIFPQGTRSIRLTKGHTGAAQMAMYLKAPVVPVGCNGSDQCYRGNSPLSSGGTIIYRIGKPLTVDGDLKKFRIRDDFLPFTQSAEKHAKTFRKVTDLFMDRINDLLDPRYRFAEDVELETGANRFI